MENPYLYSTIEKMVHFELNPELKLQEPGKDDGFNEKIRVISAESNRLIQQINQTIFKINDEQELSVMVRKHYNAVVALVNRAYSNQRLEEKEGSDLFKFNGEIVKSLLSVLKHFETSYAACLVDNLMVPTNRLDEARKTIAERIEPVKQQMLSYGNSEHLVGLLISVLKKFVRKIDSGVPIFGGEVKYHLGILEDLEKNEDRGFPVSDCPSLHALLVYWNLNSKEVIRYFTLGLEEILLTRDTEEEKLQELRYQYKMISKMTELPDFIFDPESPGVKSYFCDYILDEIDYKEKLLSSKKPKIAEFLPVTQELVLEDRKPMTFKLLCNLSIDQISLILRAADDRRILVSRSLNAVFKTIVPFLSTKNRDNLSWRSMRTKSYNGEAKDKEIAIAALEQIITRIKEY